MVPCSHMANLQLVCDGTPGLAASFALQGQDTSGVAHPSVGDATIDRYDLAFLVGFSNPADNFQIVPKVTFMPGQAPVTVNATFQVNDAASGQPLYPDPLVISIDLVPPPPAPGQLATTLVITGGPNRVTGSTAQDPGSATIPVSLT